MSCAFSAQWRVVNASPNVPFAALTLRWAIEDLGFQPVFGVLTKNVAKQNLVSVRIRLVREKSSKMSVGHPYR